MCCEFPFSQGMWGTLSAPSAEAEEASSLVLFLFQMAGQPQCIICLALNDS